MTISWDDVTQVYVVHDGDRSYRFSHPMKLKYFVHGIEWRARHMFEEYLLDGVEFEDGDLIVESGGNDGDFSLALGLVGKTFELTSFEPSPREFATLERNLGTMPFYSRAEARQQALWHSAGEALEFYVKPGTADSSILPIEGAEEVITVPATRLDAALPRQRYKLLKLEAEGAEPEILAGAEKILDCFDYVTAEGGFERGIKQQATLPEIATMLVRAGFVATRLHPHRHVMLFQRDGG